MLSYFHQSEFYDPGGYNYKLYIQGDESPLFLIAQYTGRICLQMYIKFGPEIRALKGCTLISVQKGDPKFF